MDRHENQKEKLKAIQAFCLWCSDFKEHVVKACDMHLCPFFPCRTATPPASTRLTFRIHEKCHECVVRDPTHCPNEGTTQKRCPLYEHRPVRKHAWLPGPAETQPKSS